MESDQLRTLFLTNGYEPLKIVHWKTGILKALNGRGEILHNHKHIVHRSNDGQREIFAPSVIRLTNKVKMSFKTPKYSRLNIFIRDAYTCQYCGHRFGRGQLSLEHVVPKAQGGKANWENIVTACYPCNNKKSNKTPDQAGMKLLRPPFRPKVKMIKYQLQDVDRTPEEWKFYVDEGPTTYV